MIVYIKVFYHKTVSVSCFSANIFGFLFSFENTKTVRKMVCIKACSSAQCENCQLLFHKTGTW